MRRFFIVLVTAVILGTFLGRYMEQKVNMQSVFQEENFIFLQQGVYTNKEHMEENSRKLDPKLVVFEDGKYYVYVGITKEKENAVKLEKIYEKKGYPVIERTGTVSNLEFENNLEQFDLLLKQTKKEEEILSINEVILSSYEQSLQKT